MITTPVAIDAAAVIASFPEGQRHALDTLGEVFESANDDTNDPWLEMLRPLFDRQEVQRLLGLETSQEID